MYVVFIIYEIELIAFIKQQHQPSYYFIYQKIFQISGNWIGFKMKFGASLAKSNLKRWHLLIFKIIQIMFV